MVFIDKDSKQFLQFFVNEYIKKLILLYHLFESNYLVILKFIEVPKKLTIEKFYQCEKFIDNYKIYLTSLSLNRDEIYDYIDIIMEIFESYFGGKNEYCKITNILKKIHNPHIVKGFIKLNKSYPIFFPNKIEHNIKVWSYKLYVFKELYITDMCFYRLIYNNYNWSLCKITDYETCEMLFNSVAIEKIIVYFHSILRKLK